MSDYIIQLKVGLVGRQIPLEDFSYGLLMTPARSLGSQFGSELHLKLYSRKD
jgi:hypothetical protein